MSTHNCPCEDNLTLLNDSRKLYKSFFPSNTGYDVIHGYLAVTCCVLGVVSCIINIIILTRPHMQSPSNLILTTLASIDLVELCSYGVHAAYWYIHGRFFMPKDFECCQTHALRVASLASYLLRYTCHATNLWLTVSLALVQYVFVCLHPFGVNQFTTARAKLIVFTVSVVVVVVCIPQYATFKIVAQPCMPQCYVEVYRFDNDEDPTYHDVMKYLTTILVVLLKILPCVVLAMFSILLIVHIKQADQRRKRLFEDSIRHDSHNNHSNSNSNNLTFTSVRHNHHDNHLLTEQRRTTQMLVLIVVGFIITETAPGLVILALRADTPVIDAMPYMEHRSKFEALVILNSIGNFIIYCAMSRQFRQTFKSIFLRGESLSHPRTSSLSQASRYYHERDIELTTKLSSRCKNKSEIAI